MYDPSGVGEIFRDEWPRLVSLLVRDFGDLDLAEESAQDAFLAAATHWQKSGVPRSRSAWLVTTARRKAVDRIRRETRFAQHASSLAALTEDPEPNDSGLVDEQLALLLGCCHPALGQDAQVALTLRIVGGLSTEQIANGFLTNASTMTRRISRAKAKIRAAAIPLISPDPQTLRDRLDATLRVIYLIFNEGHATTSSAALVRGDLCDEATWLAELLARLVPDDAEVRGLAALLLLIDARRSSRVVDGHEVLLPNQDRSGWDHDRIEQGLAHLGAAHALGALGSFQLQAAIASLHATAPSFDDTDWPAICKLYDALYRRNPSAVIALNRAVAVSYVEGAEAGLVQLDALPESPNIDDYPYFHSTRAELLGRAGRAVEALAALDEAIELCTNDAQCVTLTARRAALASKNDFTELNVTTTKEHQS